MPAMKPKAVVINRIIPTKIAYQPFKRYLSGRALMARR